MSKLLLQKTRKLNKILQQPGDKAVSFTNLSESLREILESNVYVSSKKGKVLGFSLSDHEDSNLETNEETGELVFSKEYNNELLKIVDSAQNLTQEDILRVFKNDIDSFSKFVTIVPINGNGQRLGTLIVARHEAEYTDEDLILAEYAATVVGMEIIRAKSAEFQEEARKKTIVQMAIGTLSFSELEAIEHIFNELDGMEGLLVASKIADRVGITRSVIVNALRKFESAGVIESRSLGMKGTYIRILNERLLEELKIVKK